MKVICGSRHLECDIQRDCAERFIHEDHSCEPCPWKAGKCVPVEKLAMSLDEAIEHAEAKSQPDQRNTSFANQCHIEHAQLAEWLKDLKEWRERQEDRDGERW